MDEVTPFQLEVITAIGMACISVPALLIAQKGLSLPIADAPLSVLVGLLFSTGSFVYVLAVSKLPVSVAAPISIGYVVIAVALSSVFLNESITLIK
jgi:drug/metabolite transporter (DMT)-like permease